MNFFVLNYENELRELFLCKNFQGEIYASHSGKSVSAKEFHQTTSCCPKKCYQNIPFPEQEEFHKSIWQSPGEYNAQNVMLAGLMTRKPVNLTENSQKKGVALWHYIFHTQNINKAVCQKFLCDLLQVGKGRFVTVQKKLKNNDSLEDYRGSHDNHLVRLTDDIKQMILDHCLSIPLRDSQYVREKSSLQYFEHPDLTVATM